MNLPVDLVSVVMIAVAFFLTSVAKIPVKKITSKLKTEAARKRANAVIYLFPLGFAVALSYCYTTFILKQQFQFVIWEELFRGGAPIVLYDIIERITGGKITKKGIQESVAELEPPDKGKDESIEKLEEYIRQIK